MWKWLNKRVVPRYAFLVLWALYFGNHLVTDAQNHWPKSSLYGLAIGAIGSAIVVILWLRRPVNNQP
jgi:hypothetical protein